MGYLHGDSDRYMRIPQSGYRPTEREERAAATTAAEARRLQAAAREQATAARVAEAEEAEVRWLAATTPLVVHPCTEVEVYDYTSDKYSRQSAAAYAKRHPEARVDAQGRIGTRYAGCCYDRVLVPVVAAPKTIIRRRKP